MPSSKQLIQDTAVRLFNERGYDKVSLRDIAREAGVAIGSLTYHFRRKEDLLAAILTDTRKHAAQQLQKDLIARVTYLGMPNLRFQVSITPLNSSTPLHLSSPLLTPLNPSVPSDYDRFHNMNLLAKQICEMDTINLPLSFRVIGLE